MRWVMCLQGSNIVDIKIIPGVNHTHADGLSSSIV